MGSRAAAPLGVGTLGGGAALPLPLYIVEAKGQPNTRILPLLAQPYPSPSSSLVVLSEALLESRAPPPSPRHRAVGSPSTYPPPLLDQEGGDSLLRT